MKNALDKALDAAMADAAEMGRINASQPWAKNGRWGCDLYLDGGVIVAPVDGRTPAEALTRARLIERAVNGIGAQAERIAELEAALDKIGTLTAYAGTPDGLRLRILQIIEPLSPKGGA